MCCIDRLKSQPQGDIQILLILAYLLTANRPVKWRNQHKSVGSNYTDNAKPAERRGRKATGPRFLREAKDGPSKDPKIAELPSNVLAKRGRHEK